MDRPDLDGLLLIGAGWACLSALVVWANLRLTAAPSREFLLFAIALMLLAGNSIMPTAADGVEYLLRHLAPRVLAAVGGSATPLFLLAAALACWTIAALGIGRIRNRQE